MLHTVIQLLVGNHRILPSLVPMQATLSFSMLHVEREREKERDRKRERERENEKERGGRN